MEWVYNRWHVAGRGIHAGDSMELRVGNKWVLVRVESKDGGRELYAHLHLDGALERFDAVSRITTPDMTQAWNDERRRDREAGLTLADDNWEPDRLRWPGR